MRLPPPRESFEGVSRRDLDRLAVPVSCTDQRVLLCAINDVLNPLEWIKITSLENGAMH